jgi:hypothetical protein
MQPFNKILVFWRRQLPISLSLLKQRVLPITKHPSHLEFQGINSWGQNIRFSPVLTLTLRPIKKGYVLFAAGWFSNI